MGYFASYGRRADTQTPTHHSVFGTSTPTRKRFPHSTACECLKAFFRHASVFKTHRHAVDHCLKEVQKKHFDAQVCFLNACFRPSKAPMVSYLCPTKNRAVTESFGKFGKSWAETFLYCAGSCRVTDIRIISWSSKKEFSGLPFSVICHLCRSCTGTQNHF